MLVRRSVRGQTGRSTEPTPVEIDAANAEVRRVMRTWELGKPGASWFAMADGEITKYREERALALGLERRASWSTITGVTHSQLIEYSTVHKPAQRRPGISDPASNVNR